MPSPAPSSSAHPRRVLVALSAVSFAAAALVYGVAVQTRAGQVIDDTPLEVARSGDLALAAATTSLSLHAVGLFFIGGLALLPFAARTRRRVAHASTAAWIVLGSAALTEGLKRLLPRPDLDPSRLGPTFPSGHTAAAMALGLALLLVAPRSLRRAIHLGAPAYVASIAAGVVVLGWHRLSDALGGVLVALGWAAAVLAFRVGPARPPRDEPPSPLSLRLAKPRSRRALLVPLAATGAAVLAAETLLIVSNRSPALGVATGLVALTAAAAVALWEQVTDPLLDERRLE